MRPLPRGLAPECMVHHLDQCTIREGENTLEWWSPGAEKEPLENTKSDQEHGTEEKSNGHPNYTSVVDVPTPGLSTRDVWSVGVTSSTMMMMTSRTTVRSRIRLEWTDRYEANVDHPSSSGMLARRAAVGFQQQTHITAVAFGRRYTTTRCEP